MIVEVFGVFKSSKARNSQKLSESVRKWESIHKVHETRGRIVCVCRKRHNLAGVWLGCNPNAHLCDCFHHITQGIH